MDESPRLTKKFAKNDKKTTVIIIIVVYLFSILANKSIKTLKLSGCHTTKVFITLRAIKTYNEESNKFKASNKVPALDPSKKSSFSMALLS